MTSMRAGFITEITFQIVCGSFEAPFACEQASRIFAMDLGGCVTLLNFYAIWGRRATC